MDRFTFSFFEIGNYKKNWKVKRGHYYGTEWLLLMINRKIKLLYHLHIVGRNVLSWLEHY